MLPPTHQENDKKKKLKPNVKKITSKSESRKEIVVRSWRLMGRKQLARLMILMFYFDFMYGVESRVPSNVNPNLANITKTALLIVINHSPWYNIYHYP